MKKQSELIFERDERSVAGFASRNRASTDAITALVKWRSRAPGRNYDQVEDGDSEYRARLTWDADDHSAGDDLDTCCNDVGVCRRSA